MRAMYPISTAAIQMHELVTTDLDLSSDAATWRELLDELRALKYEEGLEPEICYYRLIDPGGLHTLGGVAAGGRVPGEGGVGCGRATNPGFGAGIFAHEIGHMYGRLHAPCCGADSIDENSPHAEGDVGQCGMDIRQNRPSRRADRRLSRCNRRPWRCHLRYSPVSVLLTR